MQTGNLEFILAWASISLHPQDRDARVTSPDPATHSGAEVA